jgi:hypothetical protein
MKAKSEIKKKNSASKKQTLQTESAETEFSWVQSSDFFRTAPYEAQTSTESTSLEQFNSDF